jgi:hypothetical protein
MGVSTATDFTAPAKKTTVKMVNNGWVVYKSKEDVSYLVYNSHDGEFKISAPLYRFHRGHGPDTHTAEACDTDGMIFWLNGRMREADWGSGFWISFWEKVSMDSTHTQVTDGFYLPELGKDFLERRTHIGKTKTAGLGLNHRHYNISHLRITTGLRGVLAQMGEEILDKGILIDSFLEVPERYDDETGEVVESVSSRGGVTLAYTMVPNGVDSVDVTFAIAICSPKDRYDRKIGAFTVVKKLEQALEEVSKNPEKELEFVRQGKDGAYHLIGAYHGSFNVPHSIIRPTSVTGSTPYYEFRTPFFPANKIMQALILLSATELLEEYSFSKGIDRLLSVIDASYVSILVTLDRADIDPAGYFEEKMLKIVPEPESSGAGIPQYATSTPSAVST